MTVMLRRTPVWRGTVPGGLGPTVVTLGVFDGVHRGHARLIGEAVGIGRDRGLPTVLVTFDPHPARVVGPPRCTDALSTVERRAELAGELGVDAVCVLSFTRELAAMSPLDFVARILAGRLRAAAVVVGGNFTFGHRGAGTPDTLRRLGHNYGFTTHPVDLLPLAGTPCSSTHIRSCLRSGDVDGAARALGRPHRVQGVLGARGQLSVEPGTAVPAPGLYRGRLTDGEDVVVEVTETGAVVVRAARPRTGPAAVDFLGVSG
ncbi:cytidyltransferase [Amycolatopsis thermophila]|uniref:FAD synthase n=1 Tax=Amycolatopsis thermophila TaxID=206084 RepID=A0ABU0EWR9_9PSEU|nr:cytidyltransferase [Amycolatopsis thermophila]MDQ0379756.1 riboflavin kinase/FMN adenylyltransferase [Amycolatopsis thermophila]